MELHPTIVRAGLRGFRAIFTSERVTLAGRRAMVDTMAAAGRPPSGTGIGAPSVISGVAVERITPPSARLDHVLLFLHGGGYALGSAKGYRALAGNIAEAAHMRAVVPEYPLAPEHPYPRALDDMVALYAALLDDGVDPAKLVVAGDSAGGGLTLALAQRLRSAGLPAPAALGLICPWLDLAADVARTRVPGRDPLITPELVSAWAAPYVGVADPADPLISPVNADLAGLPPIVMHSAGDDPLSADARLLERRITEQDPVAVLHHRSFPGLWHDFHLQAGFMRASDEAVAEFGRDLRAHADAAALARSGAGEK